MRLGIAHLLLTLRLLAYFSLPSRPAGSQTPGGRHQEAPLCTHTALTTRAHAHHVSTHITLEALPVSAGGCVQRRPVVSVYWLRADRLHHCRGSYHSLMLGIDAVFRLSWHRVVGESCGEDGGPTHRRSTPVRRRGCKLVLFAHRKYMWDICVTRRRAHVCGVRCVVSCHRTPHTSVRALTLTRAVRDTSSQTQSPSESLRVSGQTSHSGKRRISDIAPELGAS